MANLEQRFWQKVDKTGDCWLWKAALTDSSYGVLGRGGRGTGNVRASHVSIYLSTGQWPPKGMYVCHRCDTPACVNPEHLYVGTPQRNRLDAKERGRAKGMFTKAIVGSAHNKAKLTEEQVIAIRELHATERFTYKELGEMFKCDWSNVRCIVKRQTWKHV